MVDVREHLGKASWKVGIPVQEGNLGESTGMESSDQVQKMVTNPVGMNYNL